MCATIGRAQLKRFSFTESKMASPFTIILYAEDSSKAKSISSQCFSLVDSLVTIFSDYIPNSEVNRLCETAGTKIPFTCSPVLFRIIELSKAAYLKSIGTFDITVGPLSRMWREARKSNTFPDSSLVKENLRLVGFDKVQMDFTAHTVTLLKKGMQLDFGGIAQGYIAQRVIDFLKSKDIKNALVDVSGDIVCIGRPPQAKGWTIAVNVPANGNELLTRQIQIANGAVTTSGDVFQFMEYNGQRYSHIIDPSTGYGITSQRIVTVIASNGTDADWLTKACSLQSIKESKRLALEMNAELLIVERGKSELTVHTTKKFKHFWKKP